ncbi:MAG: hypothetical protein QME49_03125, partial [bacterium]|nr:hypothetical protein [bacterium]
CLFYAFYAFFGQFYEDCVTGVNKGKGEIEEKWKKEEIISLFSNFSIFLVITPMNLNLALSNIQPHFYLLTIHVWYDKISCISEKCVLSCHYKSLMWRVSLYDHQCLH